MSTKLVTESKFLSLLLRHQPETIGLRLDDAGWASIDRGHLEYYQTKVLRRARDISDRRSGHQSQKYKSILHQIYK